MGELEFPVSVPANANTIVARLSGIALDLNLALDGADGPTRIRLQRALRGMDEMIRELRLLAVRQMGNGQGGA